jgi:hypothetical protein
MLCHSALNTLEFRVRICYITGIDNNAMDKFIVLTGAVVFAALAASCQPSLPLVPDSGREVVRPQGTTTIEKSWNAPTRSEGDAVLGPLSNMRR